MRTLLLAVSIVASTLLISVGMASSAQAQTISNSDQGIAQFLAARGYTDVRVTKRGFTITRAEACKNGEKFLVKVSLLGQINSTTKIGECGPAFGARQAVRVLQGEGYTNIDARPQGNRIVASACRQGRQFELTFARNGDLINRNRLGPCAADALNPLQVRQVLRDKGYDRIKFTDRQLPKYVAEACANRDLMRLEINRRGGIRTQRRIGNCPAAINPANLEPVLRQQGYLRVEVIQARRAPYLVRACKGDDRLEMIVGKYGVVQSNTKIGSCRQQIDPSNLTALIEDNGYDRVRVLRGNRTPYLAEACKGRNLVELTVGRFGKIRKEERVGRCAGVLDEAGLKQKLAEAGYTNATYNQRGNGRWIVEACKGEVKVDVRYSKYGELLREKASGSCASAKVIDVLTNLESRGARNTTIYVEGCYQNRKYRWRFDRLGNRTDRERLSGGC